MGVLRSICVHAGLLILGLLALLVPALADEASKPSAVSEEPATVIEATKGIELAAFAMADQSVRPRRYNTVSERQLRCLAEGIYFEARSEPLRGQLAVGRVILNRVQSSSYPDTICDVVYQNDHRHNRCQFSFACDGKPDVIGERQVWSRVRGYAAWLMANDPEGTEYQLGQAFRADRPDWPAYLLCRSVGRPIGLRAFRPKGFPA
jgi:hypothetical protein